jgi:hypothetical protein
MIPVEVINTVEDNLNDLKFGTVCLEIKIHDGQAKFRITKEISIVPGKKSSGALDGQKSEIGA